MNTSDVNNMKSKFIPASFFLSASDKIPLPRQGDITNDFSFNPSMNLLSGKFILEGEVLTPLHIQEKSTPSYSTLVDDEVIQGWDFYSLAQDHQIEETDKKDYVLPNTLLRAHLQELCYSANDFPTEDIFGLTENKPHQFFMQRITINAARFDYPSVSWLKAPTNYKKWRLLNGRWCETPKAVEKPALIVNLGQIPAHALLAPCVEETTDFNPESSDYHYFRAILPGSLCKFTINFWNLTKEEYQQLLWCITLKADLAHSLGEYRQLGCGSLRFKMLPESFLINRMQDVSDGATRRQPLMAHA